MPKPESGLSLRAYLIGIVLTVALPLAALIAYDIYTDEADIERREAVAVSRIAENAARYLSRFLTDHRLALESVAKRQGPQLLDAAHCETSASIIAAFNPAYTNLVVRDRAGDPVCAAVRGAGVPRSTIDRESWEQAMRENRFSIGKPYIGSITKRWVVLLRQPIPDPAGQVIGVISAPVDLARFDLTDFRMPTDAVTRIVDGSGTIIASSQDPEHWVGRNARGAEIVGKVLARSEEIGIVMARYNRTSGASFTSSQ